MPLGPAVAMLCGGLLLSHCTPRQAATATSDSEPIIGIAETIAEQPLLEVANQLPQGLDFERYTWLDEATETRIDSFLSVMTLAEKVGQMNQYTSFYDLTGPPPSDGSAAERFEQVKSGGVGSMLNVTGVDATRKIQELAMQSRLKIPVIFGFDVIHGFKTQFPVPLAEAATWRTDLVESGARWAAIEASANGIHWTFAPMVDISPDARWGRIVEGAGEDPYLGSVMAAARVRGFQGDQLSDANTIAACTKHFAGYGFARGGRDYNAADISDYTLYNEVLPPFKAAAEAGSATFMNGFNTRNGIPVTGDGELQRGWLKEGLNWPGFIVSDWGSIGEMQAHGFANDRADAARLAVLAGSDMDMETGAYIGDLETLVSDGEIVISQVDDAVRRILRVKFALGLFDDPFQYCDEQREATVGVNIDLRAANIEVAASSAVLLQNAETAAKLPLQTAGKRVAIIGDLAGSDDYPLGTWSLAAARHSAVTLVEAIKDRLGADSSRVTYTPGPLTLVEGSKAEFLFEVNPNTTDRRGLPEAVAAARAADVVVLALGEPGFMTGEARSRTNLDLPGLQMELYEAIIAANPNTAVVLYTGRPLDLSALAQNQTPTLLAWQPGSYGNLGIADVLLGNHDADGKLPVSFPRNVGQEPLTYREYATGRPELEGSRASEVVFYSHYMDVAAGALFPFGHGLSYTTFDVADVTLEASGLPENYGVVSALVTNTGDRAGNETLQLYIRDLVSKRTRPVKELRGFSHVSLTPGQSESVSFTLTDEHLQYWTPEEGWHVEPGVYQVWIGTSSESLGKPVEVLVE